MKKRNVVLIVLLLAIAGGLAWCKQQYPSGNIYYRMTVNVETPEGIKTSSAVRRISAYTMPKTLPEAHTLILGLTGEAVVVDLGERGVLFATLGVDGYTELDRISSAFPLPKGQVEKDAILYRSAMKSSDTVPLKLDQYPKLVYFKDIKDPKSVQDVYELETYEYRETPAARREYRVRLVADHFEEAFGKGVKLKDITIEMTGDSVTKGMVEKYLPKGFKQEVTENWQKLPLPERSRMIDLIRFKSGLK